MHSTPMVYWREQTYRVNRYQFIIQEHNSCVRFCRLLFLDRKLELFPYLCACDIGFQFSSMPSLYRTQWRYRNTTNFPTRYIQNSTKNIFHHDLAYFVELIMIVPSRLMLLCLALNIMLSIRYRIISGRAPMRFKLRVGHIHAMDI